MARTNPAFGFLVEPWSLRGYEMDQGSTYFAIGLTLLVLALAVTPKRSIEVGYSAAVVALGTIAGTILALVFGPDVVSITFSTLVVTVLSLLLSIMVYRTFKSLVLPKVPALDRFVIRIAIGLGSLVLIFAIIATTVGSTTVELNPGVAAFAGFGLLGPFALATVPRGLAANRFLIDVTVLGGAAIGLSGGSLRTTLQEAQVEAIGVAGQYKDVQVGYGWFLASAGIVILFVGAVALWVTRRDIIIARTRAREQRAAAEKARRR